MSLARRPQTSAEKTPSDSNLSEQEIEKLISRGGSSAVENGTGSSQQELGKPLEKKLRFYDRKLYERLEQAIGEEPVKVSANTWILQAILEKLERVEQSA